MSELSFDEQIRLRAFQLRISIKAVCDKAGVAYSTWWRWRNGSNSPNQSTIDRLFAALDQFDQQAARLSAALPSSAQTENAHG